MKLKPFWGAVIAGLCAGAVNGLFGSGGGMVLVPLLTLLANLDDEAVFPCSVSIILPICLVSLAVSISRGGGDWQAALPYLIGSAAGGVLAGLFGKKIPTQWLHRLLGCLVIWGGIRYIC